MPARGQAAALLVVAGLCLAGLSGCGGGVGENAVVVRVGDHAFTKAVVDHWTAVVERGGAFSGFRGAPPHGTARQRAIALLVTSNWLIGEAAKQGVAPPQATVREALDERVQGAEFAKQRRATGKTPADAELEIEAELAGEAIREKLGGIAARFSPHELTAYYRTNVAQFSTLEVRVTDLIENLRSPAMAEALVRQLGAGPRFAKRAIREPVTRTSRFMFTAEKVKLVNAIFAAEPGVVSPPMPLNGSYAVFVVRRVVPPRPKPLSSVRAAAGRGLNVARQHEIAARFDREYLARWHAVTHCHSGWIGPGCPRFKAPLESYEDPFSHRAHPLLSEAALPN